MKNKYLIIANQRVYKTTDITFLEVILTKGLKWAVATNEAITFHSVNNAVYFYKTHNVTGPQLGTDGMPYIEGPRGGKYSIFSGKPYK